MKLKCAILDDYQNVALTMTDWSTVKDLVEIRVFHNNIRKEDELVDCLIDYDIIIAMRERTPFPASIFPRLKKLKLLITSGMRNASIDLQAAKAQGVTVCGTGSRSEPPLELTWALILGLARNIVSENHSVRSHGPWQGSLGVDLYGKKLGLLGLGKIGTKMAQVGKAFGMDVVVWSQNLTEEKAEGEGVTLAASLYELLSQSDFVSIHLVLSPRTKHLIGMKELQVMKSHAFLINTSRAQIIDQKALLTALENKWIAGAGLDVYEEEPLPKDHVFRSLENVLALPHLGYVSKANYEIYFCEAVENILAYIKGDPIRRLN